MSAFLAVIGQTIVLSFRVGGGTLVGLLFFLSVVTVIPFGIGPDLPLLERIGPAILWIGMLLSTLLGLDRLFQDDRDDGGLDHLALSSLPLEMIVLARAIGHWVATGLPLVIGIPVLGLLLNLTPFAIAVTTLTLLAGSPALTFIGVIGAALMVALRRGGMLIAVLILPFTIPVLIFGITAVNAAVAGEGEFLPPFLLLVAMTFVSAVVGPVAGAAAIRAALE